MHLKSLLKINALIITTLLMSFSAFAQAPNLLNYQGVARNAVGNPLPNQSMKLRLSIHDLLPSGAVVYSEIRQITTNLGGLFSVQIGSAGASSITGTLGGVNWIVGNKFLQVELDPASNNNYIDIGTVQLASVPYAFGAGSAATVKTNANLTGVVTSVGNQTSIANGAITSDMIGTLTKSKVGLDLVNNTSDAAKPISTATQGALDLKASTADVTTALGSKLAIADSANGYVTPTQLAAKTFDQRPITNSIAGKLAIADSSKGYVTPTQLASKTFDQTPITNSIATKLNIADSATKYVTPTQLAGYNFSSGGGTSIDTTSISNRINTKANSNDVTTSLALKAPLSNPTFTGTVNGITKTMVGLGNVDNSTDLSKPISTATQTAINTKENSANKSSAADLGGSAPSDILFPTQKAVQNYIASASLSASIADGGVTTLKLADLSVTNAKINDVNGSKVTGNISGNAANVTGVIAVANGGSGASSLTGYIKGNGTSSFTTTSKIPVADVTAAVQKVNGNTPDANGNVTLAFGNVTTGTLAARPVLAGNNGDIYVISGDATVAENGRTYISDGSAWKEVTSNQAATDARYVKLSGSTMEGNVNFPTGTKATMVDAPTASTDLVNKTYVDAQAAAATTADASVSSKGKIKLAGDLSGTADLPLIANNAITTSKILDANVTNAKIASITASKITGSLVPANGGTGLTAVGTNGQVLTSDGSSLSWASPAASGMTSLNGSTASSQTFAAPGTAGTAPAWSTASGAHTLNIPLASATSVTAGLLSKADYDHFDAAYTNRISSVTTTGTSGTATLVSNVLNIPSTSLDGLAGTKAMNTIYAGPVSGANATPTFRALAAADIPTLNQNTSGNAATATLATTATTSTNIAGGLGGSIPYQTAVNSSAMLANGSSGQVLTSQGTTLAPVWAAAASSGVPYTGATSNVDLGAYALKLQGITVGVGAGANPYNTAIGKDALLSNLSSAYYNNAIGFEALRSNTSGIDNTGLGAKAGRSNLVGNSNTSIGSSAMYASTGTGFNTAVGMEAMKFTTSGSYNVSIGSKSLLTNVTGSNNTVLGSTADVATAALTNATAIGYGAIVDATDKIQLGNTSVTAVNTSGAITALSFIKSGGSAAQFLKANGTVDASTYLTSASTATTATNIAGGLGGSIPYQTAANTSAMLANGSSGQVLTSQGTTLAPVWATSASGASSLAAISGTSNAYGGTITTGILTLTPADATNGGILTNGAQTIAGAKTLNGSLTGNVSGASTIAGFSANLNAQTLATYTLVASDNGKIVTFSNTCTVTVPFLFAGFNCMIVQLGVNANVVTLTGPTNRSGFTKTAGQNAIVTIIELGSSTIISAGDMQ